MKKWTKNHSIKQAFVLLLLVLAAFEAKAERWVVNTTEWPPFTCSRCPENGAAAKALRETLKQVGIDVEFVFYNWTQALKKGTDPEVVGVFPAWKEITNPDYTPSVLLFRSPIGFLEPRDRPLQWKELKDLKGKLISTTQSYAQPQEFANLVEKKVIRTESVWDDFTNVRKVALGKVDGALMDVNNARYYIYVAQPTLAGRVNVNSRIIGNKELYFAVNSLNHGKMRRLEQGLKKVNFQRIVDDYLVKYVKGH